MADGYTRQASANIQPNKAINAEDFNAEYNALANAFDNTVGHDHSGSATGVGAKINLTTAVSGILPVANGGSGVATLTTHGVLIGEGTAAVAATATGNTNQIFISQGASADPVWSDNLNIAGTGTVAGLLTGGNISTAGTVNATGAISTGSSITATGTITGAALVLTAASLPVAQGGTGAATAAGAFANIVQAASSLGVPGYIKFQDGLILQWGQASFGGGTTAAVSFALAFPAQVYTVLTTLALAAGVATVCGFNALTTSGFAFNTSAAYTGTGYWFAVGV